ncbi:hypothetical protein ANN_25234 [Periplaneta americana]|uniref:Uncharacterized protein n=1 Tax=Periplaneta americana TaxID=6978 RepID=A0ABQ8S0R0_PERAM|nr:hypothetical protein ANN_25234 [Periplaneta americana]
MADLCEGDNELLGSLKASYKGPVPTQHRDALEALRYVAKIRFSKLAITAGGDHRANHTIPPFWLDDRPPLLRHVDVRPAAGWSVLALHGL